MIGPYFSEAVVLPTVAFGPVVGIAEGEEERGPEPSEKYSSAEDYEWNKVVKS